LHYARIVFMGFDVEKAPFSAISRRKPFNDLRIIIAVPENQRLNKDSRLARLIPA